MQVSSPPSPRFKAEPAELARGLAGLLRFFTQASDNDFLNQVDELDLTLTQLKLLSTLYELPEPQVLSVKEAAGELGISLPAASRAIEPLVKRRLVIRKEDELDRRVKRVRLTTRGETAVARLFSTRVNAAEQVLERFTPAQREKLADALNEILDRPEISRYCPRKARS